MMACLAEELSDDLASDALVLLPEGHASRAFCDEVGCVLALSNRLEHVMWCLLAYDHLHARLDNSCFVSCDFVNSVTKSVDVVQSDRSYGANEGIHNVCCVNAAAHPDLKDDDVALGGLIVHEGHQRRDLEEGQAERERH